MPQCVPSLQHFASCCQSRGADLWSEHTQNYAQCGTAVAYLLSPLVHGLGPASQVAAALFAAHPVHCEAVNTIVGRADLLSAALAVGALLCYVQAAKPKHSRMVWLCAAVLLVLASTLSKEVRLSVWSTPHLLTTRRRASGWHYHVCGVCCI